MVLITIVTPHQRWSMRRDGGERGLDLICVEERPGNEVYSSVCVEKGHEQGWR